MWIARNKGFESCDNGFILGDVHLFSKKPKRKINKDRKWEKEPSIWDGHCAKMKLKSDEYPDLKWEDEPLEVDLDINHNRWDLDICKYLTAIENIAGCYENKFTNDNQGSKICNEIYNKVKELKQLLVLK